MGNTLGYVVSDQKNAGLNTSFDSSFLEHFKSNQYKKYAKLLQQTQDSYQESTQIPTHLSASTKDSLLYWLNRTDSRILSAEDCLACAKFIEVGPSNLSDKESKKVGKFLNYLLHPTTSDKLSIPLETIQELERMEVILPKTTENLEADSLNINAFAMEESGITDIELTFRRRSYLIDPSSETLDSYVTDWLNKKTLSADISLEELASMVADHVQNNFNYTPDNTVDTWSSVEETLAEHKGDCEDLAILTASMLMNVLKRQGYADHEVRQMVKVQAGYVPDEKGQLAGHAIVKFSPGSGKPAMYLDPTVATSSGAYNTYNIDAVFEFNDRVWTKFQSIDANFTTAYFNPSFDSMIGTSSNYEDNSLMGAAAAIENSMNRVQMGTAKFDWDAYNSWFETQWDYNKHYWKTDSQGQRLESTFLTYQDVVDFGMDITNDEDLLEEKEDNLEPIIYMSWTQERRVNDRGELLDWDYNDIKYNQFWIAKTYSIDLSDSQVPEVTDSGTTEEVDTGADEDSLDQKIGDVEISMPDLKEISVTDLSSLVRDVNGGDWATTADMEQIIDMLVQNGYLRGEPEDSENPSKWVVTGDFNTYAARVESSPAIAPSLMDLDGDGVEDGIDDPDRLEGVNAIDGIDDDLGDNNEYGASDLEFKFNEYNGEKYYYQGLNLTPVDGDPDYGANQEFRKAIFEFLEEYMNEADIEGTPEATSDAPDADEVEETSADEIFKPYTGGEVDFVLYEHNAYEYYRFLDNQKRIVNHFAAIYHIATALAEVQNQATEVFADEARSQDEMEHVRKTRQENRKTRNKMGTAMNKFQQRLDQGWSDIIGEINAVVTNQNQAQNEIASLKIDQFANQAIIDGLGSQLVDSYTHTFSYIRAAGAAALAQTYARQMAANSQAITEFNRLFFDGQYQNSDLNQYRFDSEGENIYYGGPLTEYNTQEAVDTGLYKQTNNPLQRGLQIWNTYDANSAKESLNIDQVTDSKYEASPMYFGQTMYNFFNNESVVSRTGDNTGEIEYNKKALYNKLDSYRRDFASIKMQLYSDWDSFQDYESSQGMIRFANSLRGGTSSWRKAIAGEDTESVLFEPAKSAPEGSGGDTLQMFVDYKAEELMVYRNNLNKMQNKMRTALLVKQAIWDRKLEASQDISGNRSTSSASGLKNAGSQGFEIELSRLSTATEQMISGTKELNSALHRLIQTRWQHQYDSYMLIAKNAKLALYAATMITIAAVSSGIAGSFAAIMGPVPGTPGDVNYWNYALSEVASAAIEAAYSIWENSAHKKYMQGEVYIDIAQSTGKNGSLSNNPYSATGASQKITDANETQANNKLSGTTLLSDETINFSSSFMEEYMYEQRFLMGILHQDDQGGLEYKIDTGPGYSTDEVEGVPAFLAPRGDGNLVVDNNRMADAAIDVVKLQLKIKLFLMYLNALLATVEQSSAMVGGKNNSASMQKVNNQLEGVISTEFAILNGLKQEIHKFRESWDQTWQRKKEKYQADAQSVVDGLGVLGSAFAFIPTPGGMLAGTAYNAVAETALNVTKWNVGQYANEFANYKRFEGEFAQTPDQTPTDSNIIPGATTFDPEGGVLTKYSPYYNPQNDTFDDVLVENPNPAPTIGDEDIAEADDPEQALKDALAGYEEQVFNSEAITDQRYQKVGRTINFELEKFDTSSSFNESTGRTYWRWYQSEEQEKDIINTMFNDGLRDSVDGMEYQEVNYAALITAQTDLQSLSSKRVIMGMVLNMLYQAKKDQYRFMFGSSYDSGAVNTIMSTTDQYNSTYMNLLTDYQQELATRAEVWNQYYQSIIDISVASVSNFVYVVVMATLAQFTVGDPSNKGVRRHSKYFSENSAKMLGTALKTLASAISQGVIGLWGLLGVAPVPEVSSEILAYGDEEDEEAQENQNADVKSKKKITFTSSTTAFGAFANKAQLTKKMAQITRVLRLVKLQQEVTNALGEAQIDATTDISGGGSSNSLNKLIGIINKFGESEKGLLRFAFQGLQNKMATQNRAITALTTAAVDVVTTAAEAAASSVGEKAKTNQAAAKEAGNKKQFKKFKSKALTADILGKLLPAIAVGATDAIAAVLTRLEMPDTSDVEFEESGPSGSAEDADTDQVSGESETNDTSDTPFSAMDDLQESYTDTIEQNAGANFEDKGLDANSPQESGTFSTASFENAALAGAFLSDVGQLLRQFNNARSRNVRRFAQKLKGLTDKLLRDTFGPKNAADMFDAETDNGLFGKLGQQIFNQAQADNKSSTTALTKGTSGGNVAKNILTSFIPKNGSIGQKIGGAILTAILSPLLLLGAAVGGAIAGAGNVALNTDTGAKSKKASTENIATLLAGSKPKTAGPTTGSVPSGSTGPGATATPGTTPGTAKTSTPNPGSSATAVPNPSAAPGTTPGTATASAPKPGPGAAPGPNPSAPTKGTKPKKPTAEDEAKQINETLKSAQIIDGFDNIVETDKDAISRALQGGKTNFSQKKADDLASKLSTVAKKGITQDGDEELSTGDKIKRGFAKAVRGAFRLKGQKQILSQVGLSHKERLNNIKGALKQKEIDNTVRDASTGEDRNYRASSQATKLSLREAKEKVSSLGKTLANTDANAHLSAAERASIQQKTKRLETLIAISDKGKLTQSALQQGAGVNAAVAAKLETTLKKKTKGLVNKDGSFVGATSGESEGIFDKQNSQAVRAKIAAEHPGVDATQVENLLHVAAGSNKGVNIILQEAEKLEKELVQADLKIKQKFVDKKRKEDKQRASVIASAEATFDANSSTKKAAKANKVGDNVLVLGDKNKVSFATNKQKTEDVNNYIAYEFTTSSGKSTTLLVEKGSQHDVGIERGANNKITLKDSQLKKNILAETGEKQSASLTLTANKSETQKIAGIKTSIASDKKAIDTANKSITKETKALAAENKKKEKIEKTLAKTRKSLEKLAKEKKSDAFKKAKTALITKNIKELESQLASVNKGAGAIEASIAKLNKEVKDKKLAIKKSERKQKRIERKAAETEAALLLRSSITSKAPEYLKDKLPTSLQAAFIQGSEKGEGSFTGVGATLKSLRIKQQAQELVVDSFRLSALNGPEKDAAKQNLKAKSENLLKDGGQSDDMRKLLAKSRLADRELGIKTSDDFTTAFQQQAESNVQELAAATTFAFTRGINLDNNKSALKAARKRAAKRGIQAPSTPGEKNGVLGLKNRRKNPFDNYRAAQQTAAERLIDREEGQNTLLDTLRDTGGGRVVTDILAERATRGLLFAAEKSGAAYADKILFSQQTVLDMVDQKAQSPEEKAAIVLGISKKLKQRNDQGGGLNKFEQQDFLIAAVSARSKLEGADPTTTKNHVEFVNALSRQANASASEKGTDANIIATRVNQSILSLETGRTTRRTRGDGRLEDKDRLTVQQGRSLFEQLKTDTVVNAVDSLDKTAHAATLNRNNFNEAILKDKGALSHISKVLDKKKQQHNIGTSVRDGEAFQTSRDKIRGNAINLTFIHLAAKVRKEEGEKLSFENLDNVQRQQKNNQLQNDYGALGNYLSSPENIRGADRSAIEKLNSFGDGTLNDKPKPSSQDQRFESIRRFIDIFREGKEARDKDADLYKENEEGRRKLSKEGLAYVKEHQEDFARLIIEQAERGGPESDTTLEEFANLFETDAESQGILFELGKEIGHQQIADKEAVDNTREQIENRALVTSSGNLAVLLNGIDGGAAESLTSPRPSVLARLEADAELEEQLSVLLQKDDAHLMEILDDSATLSIVSKAIAKGMAHNLGSADRALVNIATRLSGAKGHNLVDRFASAISTQISQVNTIIKDSSKKINVAEKRQEIKSLAQKENKDKDIAQFLASFDYAYRMQQMAPTADLFMFGTLSTSQKQRVLEDYKKTHGERATGELVKSAAIRYPEAMALVFTDTGPIKPMTGYAMLQDISAHLTPETPQGDLTSLNNFFHAVSKNGQESVLKMLNKQDLKQSLFANGPLVDNSNPLFVQNHAAKFSGAQPFEAGDFEKITGRLQQKQDLGTISFAEQKLLGMLEMAAKATDSANLSESLMKTGGRALDAQQMGARAGEAVSFMAESVFPEITKSTSGNTFTVSQTAAENIHSHFNNSLEAARNFTSNYVDSVQDQNVSADVTDASGNSVTLKLSIQSHRQQGLQALNRDINTLLDPSSTPAQRDSAVTQIRDNAHLLPANLRTNLSRSMHLANVISQTTTGTNVTAGDLQASNMANMTTEFLSGAGEQQVKNLLVQPNGSPNNNGISLMNNAVDNSVMDDDFFAMANTLESVYTNGDDAVKSSLQQTMNKLATRLTADVQAEMKVLTKTANASTYTKLGPSQEAARNKLLEKTQNSVNIALSKEVKAGGSNVTTLAKQALDVAMARIQLGEQSPREVMPDDLKTGIQALAKDAGLSPSILDDGLQADTVPGKPAPELSFDRALNYLGQAKIDDTVLTQLGSSASDVEQAVLGQVNRDIAIDNAEKGKSTPAVPLSGAKNETKNQNVTSLSIKLLAHNTPDPAAGPSTPIDFSANKHLDFLTTVGKANKMVGTLNSISLSFGEYDAGQRTFVDGNKNPRDLSTMKLTNGEVMSIRDGVTNVFPPEVGLQALKTLEKQSPEAYQLILVKWASTFDASVPRDGEPARLGGERAPSLVERSGVDGRAAPGMSDPGLIGADGQPTGVPGDVPADGVALGVAGSTTATVDGPSDRVNADGSVVSDTHVDGGPDADGTKPGTAEPGSADKTGTAGDGPTIDTTTTDGNPEDKGTEEVRTIRQGDDWFRKNLNEDYQPIIENVGLFEQTLLDPTNPDLLMATLDSSNLLSADYTPVPADRQGIDVDQKDIFRMLGKNMDAFKNAYFVSTSKVDLNAAEKLDAISRTMGVNDISKGSLQTLQTMKQTILQRKDSGFFKIQQYANSAMQKGKQGESYDAELNNIRGVLTAHADELRDLGVQDVDNILSALNLAENSKETVFENMIDLLSRLEEGADGTGGLANAPGAEGQRKAIAQAKQSVSTLLLHELANDRVNAEGLGSEGISQLLENVANMPKGPGHPAAAVLTFNADDATAINNFMDLMSNISPEKRESVSAAIIEKSDVFSADATSPKNKLKQSTVLARLADNGPKAAAEAIKNQPPAKQAQLLNNLATDIGEDKAIDILGQLENSDQILESMTSLDLPTDGDALTVEQQQTGAYILGRLKGTPQESAIRSKLAELAGDDFNHIEAEGNRLENESKAMLNLGNTASQTEQITSKLESIIPKGMTVPGNSSITDNKVETAISMITEGFDNDEAHMGEALVSLAMNNKQAYNTLIKHANERRGDSPAMVAKKDNMLSINRSIQGIVRQAETFNAEATTAFQNLRNAEAANDVPGIASAKTELSNISQSVYDTTINVAGGATLESLTTLNVLSPELKHEVISHMAKEHVLEDSGRTLSVVMADAAKSGKQDVLTSIFDGVASASDPIQTGNFLNSFLTKPENLAAMVNAANNNPTIADSFANVLQNPLLDLDPQIATDIFSQDRTGDFAIALKATPVAQNALTSPQGTRLMASPLGAKLSNTPTIMTTTTDKLGTTQTKWSPHITSEGDLDKRLSIAGFSDAEKATAISSWKESISNTPLNVLTGMVIANPKLLSGIQESPVGGQNRLASVLENVSSQGKMKALKGDLGKMGSTLGKTLTESINSGAPLTWQIDVLNNLSESPRLGKTVMRNVILGTDGSGRLANLPSADQIKGNLEKILGHPNFQTTGQSSASLVNDALSFSMENNDGLEFDDFSSVKQNIQTAMARIANEQLPGQTSTNMMQEELEQAQAERENIIANASLATERAEYNAEVDAVGEAGAGSIQSFLHITGESRQALDALDQKINTLTTAINAGPAAAGDIQASRLVGMGNLILNSDAASQLNAEALTAIIAKTGKLPSSQVLANTLTPANMNAQVAQSLVEMASLNPTGFQQIMESPVGASINQTINTDAAKPGGPDSHFSELREKAVTSIASRSRYGAVTQLLDAKNNGQLTIQPAGSSTAINKQLAKMDLIVNSGGDIRHEEYNALATLLKGENVELSVNGLTMSGTEGFSEAIETNKRPSRTIDNRFQDPSTATSASTTTNGLMAELSKPSNEIDLLYMDTVFGEAYENPTSRTELFQAIGNLADTTGGAITMNSNVGKFLMSNKPGSNRTRLDELLGASSNEHTNRTTRSTSERNTASGSMEEALASKKVLSSLKRGVLEQNKATSSFTKSKINSHNPVDKHAIAQKTVDDLQNLRTISLYLPADEADAALTEFLDQRKNDLGSANHTAVLGKAFVDLSTPTPGQPKQEVDAFFAKTIKTAIQGDNGDNVGPMLEAIKAQSPAHQPAGQPVSENFLNTLSTAIGVAYEANPEQFEVEMGNIRDGGGQEFVARLVRDSLNGVDQGLDGLTVLAQTPGLSGNLKTHIMTRAFTTETGKKAIDKNHNFNMTMANAMATGDTQKLTLMMRSMRQLREQGPAAKAMGLNFQPAYNTLFNLSNTENFETIKPNTTNATEKQANVKVLFKNFPSLMETVTKNTAHSESAYNTASATAKDALINDAITKMSAQQIDEVSTMAGNLASGPLQDNVIDNNIQSQHFGFNSIMKSDPGIGQKMEDQIKAGAKKRTNYQKSIMKIVHNETLTRPGSDYSRSDITRPDNGFGGTAFDLANQVKSNPQGIDVTQRQADLFKSLAAEVVLDTAAEQVHAGPEQRDLANETAARLMTSMSPTQSYNMLKGLPKDQQATMARGLANELVSRPAGKASDMNPSASRTLVSDDIANQITADVKAINNERADLAAKAGSMTKEAQQNKLETLSQKSNNLRQLATAFHSANPEFFDQLSPTDKSMVSEELHMPLLETSSTPAMKQLFMNHIQRESSPKEVWKSIDKMQATEHMLALQTLVNEGMVEKSTAQAIVNELGNDPDILTDIAAYDLNSAEMTHQIIHNMGLEEPAELETMSGNIQNAKRLSFIMNQGPMTEATVTDAAALLYDNEGDVNSHMLDLLTSSMVDDGTRTVAEARDAIVAECDIHVALNTANAADTTFHASVSRILESPDEYRAVLDQTTTMDGKPVSASNPAITKEQKLLNIIEKKFGVKAAVIDSSSKAKINQKMADINTAAGKPAPLPGSDMYAQSRINNSRHLLNPDRATGPDLVTFLNNMESALIN